MNRSGFMTLVRAVRADFEANDVAASVELGLLGRQEWASPRVTIIPGHFDGVNEVRPMAWGTFGAPRGKSSVNPIELWRCTREITFDLFAVDKTAPTSEEANNDVLEGLVERLTQALWAGVDPVSGQAPGSGPSLQLAGTSLLKREANFSFGSELLIWATFEHPFYARPIATQQASFRLNKGLVAPSGRSGSIARIESVTTGASCVVAGLGFADRNWIGLTMTLAGAASGTNNGTFPILNIDGPDAVILGNPSAVADDANNGSIAWSVGATS